MLVEKLAKAVRRGRSDAEKDAAEAAAERAAAGSGQGTAQRSSYSNVADLSREPTIAARHCPRLFQRSPEPCANEVDTRFQTAVTCCW
jgi:hypothetical protein